MEHVDEHLRAPAWMGRPRSLRMVSGYEPTCLPRSSFSRDRGWRDLASPHSFSVWTDSRQGLT